MKYWILSRELHLSIKNTSHCLPAQKNVPTSRIKKDFFVTCDTYVTMTDGTGIVHIAPAFGEDDANVGRNYDLPFVQFVNEKES